MICGWVFFWVDVGVIFGGIMLDFCIYGLVVFLYLYDFMQVVMFVCGIFEMDVDGCGGCVDMYYVVFILVGVMYVFEVIGVNCFIVFDIFG